MKKVEFPPTLEAFMQTKKEVVQTYDFVALGIATALLCKENQELTKENLKQKLNNCEQIQEHCRQIDRSNCQKALEFLNNA